jgi:hypothetical protein
LLAVIKSDHLARILEAMGSRLLFAIPLTVILALLSILHAYWALGGSWGSAYAVPTVSGRRTFDPSAAATWAVCALLGMAVLLVMGNAGWIARGPLPELFTVGLWALAPGFPVESGRESSYLWLL